jgi:hypothetical protein
MTPSVFFRLPQELRDEVYKYALHHADGLLYGVSKSGIGRLYPNDQRSDRKMRFTRLRSRLLRRQNSDGPGHNQLEYVCKRLRDETQGVSMQYNCIYFHDSATTSAVEQCVSLLQRRADLRQIAIKCRTLAKEFGKDNMAAMIRHCAVHAHVLVRMHLPYWSQSDPDFVHRGLSYLWQLRGDAVLMKRLAKTTSITHLVNSGPDLLTVKTKIPLNFRFFPWEEAFSPQLFARACRERPILTLPSTAAAIGDVETLATAWVKLGL